MDDNEICKEEVCNCLYKVLVRGNKSEDCIDYGEDGFNPDDEDVLIQGSTQDYWDTEEDVDYDDDPERLAIISLNEKDSFELNNHIHTKVLRFIYGDSSVFNTKELEKFGMSIYLIKRKIAHYLDYGYYIIYHDGKIIHEPSCPPTPDIIAEAYGKISRTNVALINTLNRLTRASKKFTYKCGINKYTKPSYKGI